MNEYHKLKELINDARISENPKPIEVVKAEEFKPNPAEILQKLADSVHRYGDIISEMVAIIGFEGSIDTSGNYPPSAIDPLAPPQARVIKFRHTRNIQPADNPNFLPVTTNTTLRSHQQMKIRPEDDLNVIIEHHPATVNGQFSDDQTVIDIKIQAWNHYDTELNHKLGDQFSIAPLIDSETGEPFTSVRNIYPSGKPVEEIITQQSIILSAMTPLIIARARKGSYEVVPANQLKSQEPQPIQPPSIPTKIIDIRAEKRRAA